MSAIGCTALNDKIVLLSDGLATQGGNIVNQSFQKAFKVNAKTGFFWLGMYPNTNSLKRMKTYLKGYNGNLVEGVTDS